MPGDGGAREWFGEVLGSSRTVLARGNREESRNGFKVDSDICGIGTSIWRGFKGGD
uniref:Uncharacterized protein n=1 Tax=Oryza rufipogon TaxID=4529 RepID=A0A0E0MQX3_ORYRU